ncbi:hypothetical protein MLD38_007918 [Melastoma candidum]|uniref:Uncharacterized protein n=1 Tax=Melastoma candidum TaxID=119954 RepID=A0ACB9RUK0_9MYRT|nr:hypothetical protein MLD38_007918 [Melastoma candidum]
MDGVPYREEGGSQVLRKLREAGNAVDELFRGLLAAQTDVSGHETEKPIAGLLDGTGEYTLVMFVATAKRLRVLKRCDLSVINLGGRKQENKSAL